MKPSHEEEIKDEIEISYSDDEDIPYFGVPYQIEWDGDIISDVESLDDKTKEYRRQRSQKTEKRLEEMLSIFKSDSCQSTLFEEK